MSIFKGIRNANHEPVEFDRNLPFLFIDIDGVINPVPYEKEWVGAEDSANDPLSISASDNWAWRKIKGDPTLHYPITRELTVELDKWAGNRPISETGDKGGFSYKRYMSLVISLADEMLEELRELIKLHKVQVVYLTYWRSEAIRLLEGELQLGAIGYLDWFADFGDHALKISALADFYRENDLRNPFVVIDDEALKGLNTATELWYFRKNATEAENLAVDRLNEVARLYLQPDPRWGIDRGQVQQLRGFLDSLEKPV